MRTLVTTLGLVAAASTLVVAQHNDIAGIDTRDALRTRTGKSMTKAVAAKLAAMPKVNYYTIAEGEDEDFPPGLYATFLPSAPDTVTVFTDGRSAQSYHFDAGREMIHGDSASVFAEVAVRKDAYAGMGTKPATVKSSYVTRSGYIPIERLGQDRFKFAVKPSHFRIAPGAMISASVQLEGDEDLSSILCIVSAIDYDRNTFTIETSRNVPVGETINWVIVNYPE